MRARPLVPLAVVVAAAACGQATADHATATAPATTASASATAAVPAPDPGPLTLAFAGDVMFGRFVPDGFQPIEAERHDPFVTVEPLLAAADLAVVNLETPVMAEPPPTSRWGTRMRFVATPDRLATLAAAGVDVVSLANNHHYDLRTAGVAETPGHVAAAGMKAIGIAAHEDPLRIESVTVRGRRIALIAATTVRNGLQREGEPLLPHCDWKSLRPSLVPLVEAARADHDVVIAVLHWGTEYDDAPGRWQIDAAHAMVDAGADLVIGSHPHVLQAVERYRGGLIAYSLGNFLFDNTTEIPRLSGVLTVTVGADRCIGARFDPAIVRRHPEHHVEHTPGRRGRIVRERMRTLSAARPFRTPWRDDGDALVLDAACPPPPPPAVSP